MEGLFIYVFVLIILVVALLKWNLANLETIKYLKNEVFYLKMDNEELNVKNDSLYEENKKFKELLEIQNKLITDLEK